MRPEDLPQPFTRTEAVLHGVSDRRLGAGVRRGELVRVAPAVYATACWTSSPPWEQHRLLALAARRNTPDAILSHTSAAALLGLPLPPRLPLRATLTLLHDARTSPSDAWRELHRGATPASCIAIRGGHPELVPSRTVLDSIRILGTGDGLALLDGALRRGLVTRHGLREMRRQQRRWQGVTRFDAVVDLASPLRESWLESASAWLMASCHLPVALPQVVVLDAAGRFVARVDALWAEHGVAGEADGLAKYTMTTQDEVPADAIARSTREQLWREDRLRDLGLVVVRWATPDLQAPLGLLERVTRAFERAEPSRVTARFRCSCCRRPLTDCPELTRIRACRVNPSQWVA